MPSQPIPTRKAVPTSTPLAAVGTKRSASDVFAGEQDSALNSKRIRLASNPDFDKIDPVEKLLSLTNVNYDFLADIDAFQNATDDDYTFSHSTKSHSCSSIDACCDQQYPSHSVLDEQNSLDDEATIKLPNFTQILNENLRKHYLRSARDTYRSKFSILNPQSASSQYDSGLSTPSTHVVQQAPIFRTVDFNPPSSKSRGLEEFVQYDNSSHANEEDDSVGPTSPLTTLSEARSYTLPSKMSFHYRHGSNDNLNLAQPSFKNRHEDNYDVQKVLNTCLLMSGKGSEMLGSSKFLINDFLL